MAQVRVGDRVRAFLDANVVGIVEHLEMINPNQASAVLMVGGVPPGVVFAHVRCANNTVHRIMTTELYVEKASFLR